MKVCFFGIYDPAYPRNDILMQGLRANGAEVIECRADWRDPKRYRKLWRSLRALHNEYDVVFAAFPSPMPAIVARLASRRPVVADAFYSMFDAVVNDRKKRKRWSLKAIRLLILDWLGAFVPHMIIVDTDAHKRYWSSWLGMKSHRIRTVRIGANDRIFRPLPPSPRTERVLVQFHGTYVPLQGTRKIVEAARLCAADNRIRFRMIGGTGGDFSIVKPLADSYGLANIEFADEIRDQQVLNTRLSEADIILGIFGDSDKAYRVIPNKVYEGLAVQRAVLTMDSPAVREVFSEHDMCLVANDPRSIADAVIALANDPLRREALAEAGHRAVAPFYPQPLGAEVLKAMQELTYLNK